MLQSSKNERQVPVKRKNAEGGPEKKSASRKRGGGEKGEV